MLWTRCKQKCIYVFDRYFLQQMHESNVDEVTWHSSYVFYQYVHLLGIKPMISSSLYPVQGRSKMFFNNYTVVFQHMDFWSKDLNQNYA